MSLWRQSAVDRGRVAVTSVLLIVKRGLGRLGHWQTVQTQIRRRITRRLISVFTVCLNDRKLWVEWNNLKSPPILLSETIDPDCCRCFDLLNFCQPFYLHVQALELLTILVLIFALIFKSIWAVTWETNLLTYALAVWSVFVVRMKRLCILSCPKCAQRRFWCAVWSESSLGAHVQSFIYVVTVRLLWVCIKYHKFWYVIWQPFLYSHMLLSSFNKTHSYHKYWRTCKRNKDAISCSIVPIIFM